MTYKPGTRVIFFQQKNGRETSAKLPGTVMAVKDDRVLVKLDNGSIVRVLEHNVGPEA